MKEEKDKKREYHRLKRSIEFVRAYDKEACWDRLVRRLRERRLRRLAVRVSAAAAVLLAGVFVGLLYPSHERAERTAVVERPRVPEVQGVTLVLGNGERVNLESREGSIAAGEGGTRISNEDRQLTYEAGGTADTVVKWNRLIVPRGGEYQLNLADGTRIWLNAGSELEYPETFAGKREVRLKGEAYFEVAKDSAKAFVVHAGKCAVEVLGTRFNVSAYPEEALLATLAEGSVRVGKQGNMKLLRPNEQAVVRRESDEIVVRRVDASQYISWVRGKYVFKNTSLDDVAARMGRWYDVEFRFAADSLRVKRMAGVISRNETLEFSLGVLERVAGVRFEQRGDTIYIKDMK